MTLSNASAPLLPGLLPDAARRLRRVGVLLEETRCYWHPQPFREPRPAWCSVCPELAQRLLDLDDPAVAGFESEMGRCVEWLSRWIPRLRELDGLTALPVADPAQVRSGWEWEVPGRKQRQIEALVARIRPASRQLVDWCGGKGHLGRCLAWQGLGRVTSLDIDATLCAEGERLAGRLGLEQSFSVQDALMARVPEGGHVVALHACGHLHRALLGQAGDLAALDLAPCCYHLGVNGGYPALSGWDKLGLSYDDVRLAVTETVTASTGQQRRRGREMAWKLAFDGWRRSVGNEGYRTFKPVPASWSRGNFGDFLAQLCAREGLPLPGAGDLGRLEAIGYRRAGEVARLSLVRHAFRRALEIWINLDFAVALERAGMSVGLSLFCAHQLTPRNILLSARR